MQELDFTSVRPFVRYVEDARISHSYRSGPIVSCDHRLFYVISGRAQVRVEDTVREVGAGGVLYWLSGTAYSLHPVGDAGLRMIKVNFDMTQAHRGVSQPIPVVAEQDWDPSQQLEHVTFTDASALNKPLILSDVPGLLQDLHEMTREETIPMSFRDFQLSNRMSAVLTLLYREAQQRQSGKKVPNGVRDILDYVNSHYAQPLSNRELAAQFGYHVNYISQLILEQTGMPLHRYLLRVRIRQALNLLTTTQLSVGEIARAVGFQSTSYFIQYFRQCTGHPPGAFRKG